MFFNFFGQFFAPKHPHSFAPGEPGKTGGAEPADGRSKRTKIEYFTPEYINNGNNITVKVPCKITVVPEQNILTLAFDVIVEGKTYHWENWKKTFPMP